MKFFALSRFVLLIFLFLCYGQPLFADNNDDFLTATDVDPNGSETDNIDSINDKDYFRIILPSAGTLTVYTTGLIDTRGALFDSNETLLGSDNDSGAAPSNFSISRYLPAGTYYVGVRGSGNPTAPYFLVSTFVSDDHSNEPATATTIPVSSDETETPGELEMTGDQDVFRIDLTTDGILTVYTTGTTDTLGALLDSGGNPLEYDDNSGDEPLNFSINRYLPAGTYYVRVEGSDSRTIGQYTLVSSFEIDDDHGDDRSTATIIPFLYGGSSMDGEIEVAGDIDVFRIDLPIAGTLMIYTTGSTDTFGDLLDNSGASLETNDISGLSPANFRISRDLAAGVYYIQVSESGDDATGRYTLVAEYGLNDDHGNTPATATPVSLSLVGANRYAARIGGQFEQDEDVDVFRFQISNDGTLRVFTVGPTDTDGNLYRNSSILASDDNSGPNSSNFLITVNVLSDLENTYYIEVRPRNNSIGPYTLAVAFNSSDDHGNDRTTATVIPVSIAETETPGQLDLPGDQDFFRIELLKPGTLTVYSTGNTDTYGYLLDENGLQLANNDDNDVSGNFRIRLSLSPGIYYIRVRGYDRATTGGYTLVTQFNSGDIGPGPGDDHGNDIATATLISASTTNGQIEIGGDNDFFQLNLPNDGTLAVYTTGTTDTFGYLLDSNGHPLASNDDSDSTGNFRISRRVSAGIYYVQVLGYDSNTIGDYVLVTQFWP